MGPYEFWDLGDEDRISLCDKPLANVLRSLILCDGQVTDTFSLEKKWHEPEMRYSNRNCAVLFRIKLPVGMRETFERVSGLKLRTPPKISLN